MLRFHTKNSSYEVDAELGRVRRLSHTRSGSGWPVEDGVWAGGLVTSVEVGNPALVWFSDGTSAVTSSIASIEPELKGNPV